MPAILDNIASAVETSLANGDLPTVLFDLDDTLFYSGSRTLLILKELTTNQEILAQFSELLAPLKKLQINQIKYDLSDTLLALGVENRGFHKAAKNYWSSRFFSSVYAAADWPIECASSYVNSLYNKGVTIKYVTGRDSKRMRLGTEISLRANNFPLGEKAILITKPNLQISDKNFKEKTFKKLATTGSIIAGFDNEPENVNLMKVLFPEASIVHLDTKYSDQTLPLLPNIATIKTFNH